MSLATESKGVPSAGTASEWISAREVHRITGLAEKMVPKAAAMGLLTVRLPIGELGGLTKYGWASAEALAASRVVPARSLPTPAPAPSPASPEGRS